jgi:3,4-dihydroxy 2-butanone 4-phosphate synthase/GTP cyclohydrolase II
VNAIEDALDALAAGRPVVVVDDEHRENEGDLIMAASAATAEWLAFFLEHTSGVFCVALPGERTEALGLDLMVAAGSDRNGTAFTVSVDAREGTTTGISAEERARTVRLLADPAAAPGDLTRPGHVFPLRARDGGVLTRAGHTEAAVDLAVLAGCAPAGLLCEVTSADRRGMARLPELRTLADAYGLHLVSIADLVRHRSAGERLVARFAEARMPTRHGVFRCVAWRSMLDGTEHLALVMGEVRGGEPVLVRVHSECLTGDVLGSLRCDCGEQLDASLAKIGEEGRGVVVYLRGHEGRGIGLGHKLRAYGLQDAGRDTVDANTDQGLPVDSRDYGTGAQILASLGVRRLRLLTNNPAKYTGLRGYGLEIVERVPIQSRPTADNIRYLRAKQSRLGHLLDGFEGSCP